MDIILILKSIHIVSFVAWIAGLFFLVRLLVYNIDTSQSKPSNEAKIIANQLVSMQNEIYKYICNVFMMVTWSAGLLMIYLHGYEWFGSNKWMHYKLLLLILLTIYHLMCKDQMKRLKNDNLYLTKYQLILFNGISFIFLIAISTLAVFKSSGVILNSLVILVVTSLLILFFILMFKQKKEIGNKV